MLLKLKNFFANIILAVGYVIVRMGDKLVLQGVEMHIKLNTETGKKFKKIKDMASLLNSQTNAPKELKQNAKRSLEQKTGVVYAPKK